MVRGSMVPVVSVPTFEPLLRGLLKHLEEGSPLTIPMVLLPTFHISTPGQDTLSILASRELVKFPLDTCQ